MDKVGKYDVSELDNGTPKVSHDSINGKTIKVPDVEPMTVNGVWNIDQLPSHYVVELSDGSIAKFFLTPFRAITQKDLTVYEGYHPRKMKGQPMPEYLYRFYGLKLDPDAPDATRVRLKQSEKALYKKYCQNVGTTESDDIREYIRSRIYPEAK